MDDSSEEVLAELLKLRKEVTPGGVIRYYNSKNQVHRVHGPAIIWHDKTKIWYQDGKRHRVGGPAIEFANGTKEWWEYGEYVRSERC